MQARNKPTEKSREEFKENCPLEINKRYIVKGYRLNVSIKTRHILSINAYPTQELRAKTLTDNLKPITVNVEVYLKALIEVGLFQAMENKYRKAKALYPNGGRSYRVAKELLVEAAKQNEEG